MEIIRGASLIETPWKNGGGITREIAAARDGADLLWRVSMADVASGGPFSDFSGMERLLTVIAGAGMDLKGEGISLAADPFVPLRFDGGLRLSASLRGGPLRDLNVIFDPTRVCAQVRALQGAVRCRQDSAPRETLMLVCVGGVVTLETGATLEAGDTAVATAECLTARLPAGARGLLIGIAPAAEG